MCNRDPEHPESAPEWEVFYLGCEHVSNPVDGALQQQSSNQEADQDKVGKQGAEVHHLQEGDKSCLF